MASTSFTDFQTPAIPAAWLNDTNRLVYQLAGDGVNAPTNDSDVRANLGAAKNGANSDITSLTGLTTPLSVAQGGTGETGGAWTSQAVTLTSSGGVLGTSGAVLRFQKIGRTVNFSLVVTILLNGTGSGTLQVTLPWSAAGESSYAGRESQTSGVTIAGTIGAASASMTIVKYDNTYPGANNHRMTLSGVLEVTA